MENNTIIVKQKNHDVVIDIMNICYCKAEGCYTTIFLKTGEFYMDSKPLNKIEGLLYQEYFCRCHNSFLVNLMYVNKIKINERTIYLSLYQVPISHRKLINLLCAYNRYCNGKMTIEE